MLQQIRILLRQNLLLRKLIAYYIAPSGLFDRKILSMKTDENFKRRTEEVLACSDNGFIPRVKNAGKVVSGKQIMHNGLKIYLGSYYGPEVAQQLYVNKGVHEPQEERVFAEVLKSMKDGAVMIELGSFWAFYSMWFQSVVKNAKNFMIEPDDFNMGFGVRNFKLNNFKGKFTNAFIGSNSDTTSKVPVICIDDFAKDNNIDFIDILHSDIQGYELEMLQGINNLVAKQKIGYIFISTHSNEVHYKCRDFLLEHGFTLVAEADKDNTFAEDGLIVAKQPGYAGVERVEIAQKVKQTQYS
jgi:hypothetical protein